jgi:DNA-binding CsgD family transcriptional regulator
VAQNTVRTELKSVFVKTGVHRQAELIGLLALPTYGEATS